MVSSSYIDLRSLTLDELTGVVNLYPWYGAAHVELGRRMSKLGGDSWGEKQYADGALYVSNRLVMARLARRRASSDFSDKDLGALLASFLEPSSASPEGEHQVRVVGGDYFSQAQYDNVKESGDNIFSRFAFKSSTTADDDTDTSDIAENFATETLARIFAEQGRTQEARRIYSRLILEFPEKSAYFASLIDNLT